MYVNVYVKFVCQWNCNAARQYVGTGGILTGARIGLGGAFILGHGRAAARKCGFQLLQNVTSFVVQGVDLTAHCIVTFVAISWRANARWCDCHNVPMDNARIGHTCQCNVCK
jgi:hypothetical protein